MGEWEDGRLLGALLVWIDGRVCEWMAGWMDAWMGGWMFGWIYGWMGDGWMGAWVDADSC